MVEVKGAVFRPGMYQIGDEISTVRSLIEASEGLTEEAFTARAVMHRMNRDRTLKVISLDIEGIMSGKSPDVALQNEDVIFIPTISDRTTAPSPYMEKCASLACINMQTMRHLRISFFRQEDLMRRLPQ